MAVPVSLRWVFGIGIALFVTITPYMRYRAAFDNNRRLRVVTPGVLYRSGCMTRQGFEEAIRDLHIKTVVNLQDEFPDPALRESYFDSSSTSEIELCKNLGVQYVFVPPDLVPRPQMGQKSPEAIAKFLAVMDNPDNFPVLIHCKAGLNRTGVIVAVYRMEYQGWTSQMALNEARGNGWPAFTSSAANLYIEQYVTSYRARGMSSPTTVHGN